MSSTGAAEILLLPVEAVAGAGRIFVKGIAQGITWCGQKMREHYESACQSYTELATQEFLAQQSQQEDRHAILAAVIDQYTTAANLRGIPSNDQSTAAQTAIAAALNRAREALNSMEEMERLRQDHAREAWQQALQQSIKSVSGIVPHALIMEAQKISDRGSIDEMSTMYQQLQNSLQTVLSQTTDMRQVRMSQVQQTHTVLANARRELESLKAFLAYAQVANSQWYVHEMQNIESLIQQAQRRSDVDPERSLHNAQEAQRMLVSMKQQVTDDLDQALSAKHRQVIKQTAQLDALDAKVREVRQAGVLSDEQAHTLLEEIADLRTNIVRAELSANPDDLQQWSVYVASEIDRVLRAIGDGQQQTVVHTIAETLRELGFSQLDNGPRVEKIGMSTRIVARRPDVNADTGKMTDERMVTFYVNNDGHITYNFTGYMGDACTKDATLVFAALREKGIAILDASVEEKLRDLPAESITPELLLDSQFAPQFDANHPQTRMQEYLTTILRKMGFTNIHQKATSGSIIIDAYNGPIGYHIILPDKGMPSLRKNGYDISHDASDELIVAAADLLDPLLPSGDPVGPTGADTLSLPPADQTSQTDEDEYEGPSQLQM